jgi:glycosyltransferase involved in cell wall biosynthesis
MFFVLKRHAVVLSIHNEEFISVYSKRVKFIKSIMSYLINRLDAIVLDNQKILKLFSKDVKSSITYCIPEYIRVNEPVNADNPLYKKIDQYKKSKKYLISSNVTRIVFFNNEDLYGIDLMVDAVNALVNIHDIDIGVVIVISSDSQEEYFQNILKIIKMNNIEDNFMIIDQGLSNLAPLWKLSDIVIRATNTDGNSLTVLEALEEKTPVIASDCVPRPDEVILFKNRDVDSLLKSIMSTLSNIDSIKSDLSMIKQKNNAKMFMNLYMKIESNAE